MIYSVKIDVMFKYKPFAQLSKLDKKPAYTVKLTLSVVYKAQATAIMVSVKMRASEHTTSAMPSKRTATRRLVR